MNMLDSVRRSIGIAILALVFSSMIAEAGDEESAIRACFKNYQAAIAKKDGSAAAALISSTTLKYYAGILDLALNADEAKLRKQGYYHKMMALLVRHEAPDLYRQLNGNTNGSNFFALVVSNGWGGEIGSAGLELGKITKIVDVLASAPAVLNGQETPARFVFELERDGWKFSLLDVIVRVDQIMKKKQKDSSVNADDAIIQAIEKRSGRTVSMDIWKPLKRT